MDFTASQSDAINRQGHKVGVVAGPGSGKTKVLVERLENERTSLVITFSNAGANEIRKRLPVTDHAIMTLHAFLLGLIRRNPSICGFLGKPSIFPEHRREAELKRIRNRLRLKISDRLLRTRTTQSEMVWKELEQELRRENLIDLDGVLVEGARLVSFPEGRPACPVYVDEAQDSGWLDWKIYSTLNIEQPLFFVGDPDQSIYQFRGARPDLFLEQCRDDGRTQLIALEETFRCGKAVCRAANALISHQPDRIDKQMIPTRDEEGVVTKTRYATDQEEVAAITRAVQGVDGTVAILCRTNRQAAKFALLCPRIDYSMPFGWNRALAVLSFLANPSSNMLAMAVMTGKPEQVEAAERQARAAGLPLAGWAVKNLLLPAVPTAINSLSEIPSILCRFDVEREAVAVIEPELDHARTLPELLTGLHGMSFGEAKPQDLPIEVLTIHAAKGREWDIVYLPAMEACKEEDELPEERRLYFVGLSRARREAHVSWHASRREQWGEVEVAPSLLFDEIEV